MTKPNFDDLRPYYDHEVQSAMQRIVADPLFAGVAGFLYPDKSVAEVAAMISSINSSFDFQKKVMYHAITRIAAKTMTKFTCNGLQFLDKNKAYLFISNHRDILLDSALLQIALSDNNLNTSEITFGSNLMQSSFVVDIGKSNKMFKVVRGGTPRDFYRNSLHLSQYIRHTILEKNESIWIAHRNGRTKDGNDLTDQAVLKMFSMSGDKDLIDNLLELNITPMVVSYQWETCDVSKVNELYISKTSKYEKKPGEDLQSILNGITQFKGNVHIEVTDPVTREEIVGNGSGEKPEIFNNLTSAINKRIHLGYALWDSNYIAYDIENNSRVYEGDKYSASQKEFFIDLMNKRISLINGNKEQIQAIYLQLYSNPLKNALMYK
ncbi:MAG: acyltransferase [Bacteroidales bacterium]|nr:acyltransferase [Bacteroidales bacterium]HOY38929.1 acyltransferase [Bacteroidales bacterium]HQN92583.1 hypothetical protein [Prolixibacteraceae bacterium]